MINIEVCVNGINSIKAAEKGGAFRIELCDNLAQGGTTPSIGMIKTALTFKNLKTFVIIRPRGGDFIYTDEEFQIMKSDLITCGKLGCAGVVFGILTEENKIDIPRNKILNEVAKNAGMQTTFHRAFDRISNLEEALEAVLEIGCDRILTSGGMPTAIQGKEKIMNLIEKAGENIKILPGGGITEQNIKKFVANLRIQEVHGTFKEKVKRQLHYTTDYFYEDMINYESSSKKIKEAIKQANNKH